MAEERDPWEIEKDPWETKAPSKPTSAKAASEKSSEEPLSALSPPGFEAQMAEPERSSGKEFLRGVYSTVPRLLAGLGSPVVGLAKHYLGNREGEGLFAPIAEQYLGEHERLIKEGTPPSTTAGRLGGMAGDVAASVLVPTSRMRWLTTKPILRDIATQTAMGAALAPEGSRVAGGATGALGTALGAAGKTGLRPFVSPEAEILMLGGVQPTVGQALGGTANRAEQALMSFPIIGDFAAMARRRPLKEVEAAAVNRAVGGTPEAVRQVGGNIYRANRYASDLFESVAPHFVPTSEAVTNVQAALRRALRNPEIRGDNQQLLVDLVNDNFQNFGQLRGTEIQNLDRQLGFLARRYAKGSPEQEAISSEIYNIQDALRRGLERGLPPELKGVYQKATTTFRNLIPLNKAESATPGEIMMPWKIQKEIARHGRTDVSRLPYDPYLNPASAILPSRFPNSGTVDRALWAGLFGLGGYGAHAVGALPQVLGVGAGLGLGATRAGQAALLGNTALQQVLSPGYVGALTSALTNASNQP